MARETTKGLQDIQAGEAMIDWKPGNEKPEAYRPVLLALVGNDFTTGHWADGANCWMGYAFNQSPPTYRLEDYTVIKWAEITPRP